MTKVVKIKRGLNIPLKGVAAEVLNTVAQSSNFSIVPDDFSGVKPKPVVKEGEKVKVGTVLFIDKNRPEIKFVSPVSGVLTAINRGDRRKIMSFAIQADAANDSESFSKQDVAKMSVDEVKQVLLDSGLWPFVKQRPYDIVANPADSPRSIYVSGFDSAPLAPDYDFVFKGQEAELQVGFDVLKKLCADVNLGISVKSEVLSAIQNVNTIVFDGPHPAGNVGVQINNTNPINKGEKVWVVALQDVLVIGKLFLNGVLDFTRTIALVGSEVKNPSYYKVVYGSSIENIVKGNVTENASLRYISGNPLTGIKIDANGALSAYASQITVIPEGDDNYEMLGWVAPGFNKFSASRLFFSWLCGKKQYVIDARVRGGKRAIINSNEYDKVFPMDIYPEYLIKAIIAKDIEKMENLGIYEVAPEDFALCEFVCTSKMDLQQIVREGLDYLRSEVE